MIKMIIIIISIITILIVVVVMVILMSMMLIVIIVAIIIIIIITASILINIPIVIIIFIIIIINTITVFVHSCVIPATLEPFNASDISPLQITMWDHRVFNIRQFTVKSHTPRIVFLSTFLEWPTGL